MGVILGGGVVGVGGSDEPVGLVVAVGRGGTGDGLRCAVRGFTGVGVGAGEAGAFGSLSTEGVGKARAGDG
jgi:hypothetical protein